MKQFESGAAVALLLAVVTTGIAGCGSGGGDATHPQDADAFTAAMTAIICADATGVCCEGGGASFSKASCEMLVKLTVNDTGPFSTTLNGAPPTFNKGAARECLAAVKGQARGCSFNLAWLTPPCGVVRSAAVPVDGSCTVAADCAQPDGLSVVCESGSSGSARKCRARTIVGAGMPCSADSVCTAVGGLVCRGDSHVCAPQSDPGGACGADHDCPPATPYCRDHVCVAPALKDQPCGLPAAPQTCAHGLSCAANVCAPAPSGGAACVSGANACEDGSVCTPLGNSQLKCVSGVGAVCSY